MSDGDPNRDRLAVLLEEIAAEFPGFCVVDKTTSRFQRAVHWALLCASLGQARSYLDGYHTTMGRRVYVAPGWESMSRDHRYLVLRHERVHLRQFRRYTFAGMALLYLLVPLPVGLAYFRARFERAAYEETIRGAAELYGPARVAEREFRDRILDQFTGPAYGWMWPFRRSLERWYEGVLAAIGRAGV